MKRSKFLFLSLLVLLVACERELKIQKTVVPESDLPGGVLYKKFCSACHAPPRIASHKADEWLGIVSRMQIHRIKKAYSPLSESELAILIPYLKRHSVN